VDVNGSLNQRGFLGKIGVYTPTFSAGEIMKKQWTRSDDGALFGVCKGIAKHVDVPVGILRLIWLGSVLIGGSGLGVYLLLALSLPKESQASNAYKPRLLGVCANLASRLEFDVGLFRFVTLCVFLISLGMTSILYLAAYFFLPQPLEASRNNASSPPSTT
jgi:phage shock protein PspC (stress-responsive transcriptional regulator)